MELKLLAEQADIVMLGMII